MAVRERQLVLVVVDLAHFASAVGRRTAVEIATIVDGFLRIVGDAFTDCGGTIVKYLGDGCLVVLPPDRANDAVTVVEELSVAVERYGSDAGVPLALGANIHIATVAEGTFGIDDRYDVFGTGVMHAFRMGGGPGIRISEPVYRKLPNDTRPRWSKHQPPATYTRGES